jgi:hypothetical protein
MRKYHASLAAFVFLIIMPILVSAQQNQEKEIRNLENAEGQAWVKKDSVTLFKLFSADLVVNTPLNRVATLEDLKNLMRAGKIDLSSSEKIIKKISFIDNLAVVMGNDIIKPQGLMEHAGKTVTRQYTDIWIKDKSGWHLTVRQATNISVL